MSFINKFNSFLLIALILALFSVSATLSKGDCGRLFDGDKKGHDIDEQTSTSEFHANWEGFPDGVELALVSSEEATEEFLHSGDEACDNSRCRTYSDVKGKPTVDFESASGGSHIFDGLDLDDGEVYYLVLRFESKGAGKDGHIYTNSDGVLIKKKSPPPDDSKSGHHHSHKPPPPRGSKSNGSSSSGEDDDDDLADWQIGLIFMGCALCCLLILLLILLLVLAKGKGEDKYTTTVHRNDNVEKT